MNKEHISKVTLEQERLEKLEKLKEEKENLLLETKTFTPVTKEAFAAWFSKFYKANNKIDKQKLEQETRLSGREWFMNAKNAKLGIEDDNEEDIQKEEEEDGKDTETNEKANALFYDADAFDENLDDIDFDKVDLGDDEINVDDI